MAVEQVALVHHLVADLVEQLLLLMLLEAIAQDSVMVEMEHLDQVAMLAPVVVAGTAVVVLIQMAVEMTIKVEEEDLTLPLLVKIVNMYQKVT